MPIKAKIYKPAKSAMQSGRAGTKDWVLAYEDKTARRVEPVMGWVSAGDTLNEVQIRFNSKDAAIAFAAQRGFSVTVIEDQTRKIKPRSYLDNFKFRPYEEEAK